MSDAPPPGDNRLKALDPENLMVLTTDEIASLLDLQYAELTARSEELLEKALTWAKGRRDEATGTIIITDDAQTNFASDLYKQLDGHAGKTGEVEETRKKVKLKPFEATKAIDAWFANLRDRLTKAMERIDTAQNAYSNKKRADERHRLQMEADVAAAEAQILLAAARKKSASEATIQKALEAEQAAEDARAASAQPAADLTRTRSAMGTTSSQQETWKFRVTDLRALLRAIAAMEQPVAYVQVNESLINAAIRGRNGIRDIPGLEIYPEYALRRRGT